MPYRVKTACVVAVDREGQQRYYYLHGPDIPWLNYEQHHEFLRRGLVEALPGTAAPDRERDISSHRRAVRECLEELAALGVPNDAGFEPCRWALRHSKFNQDVIGLAQRERSWPSLFRTTDDCIVQGPR